MREQRKNLVKYILPAMMSNASFFILTVVDGMFVGNGIGTDALGAVSLAMPYVMVVGALSVLISIGGVTVASVRIGRGDIEGANMVFMHSIIGVSALFAVLTVAGTVFSEQIAVLLGANATYKKMVTDYIFWYSIFAIPAGLVTTVNAFCRNDGDPGLSTAGAITTTIVNIIGDWIMVYPLQMGIAGAAIATGLSAAAGTVLVSSHYFLKRGKLRFKKAKLDFGLFKKIIIRGLPEMVSQFAAPITTFSMNRMLLANLGDAAVNAFSVICYAGSLFSSLSYGVASGLQPMFGLSYGSKDDKSLRFYINSGFAISVVGGILIFLITFFIGGPICTLFGADADAYVITVSALPKYCLNYVFAAISAVMASYLFSTKRTQYALVLNFCRSLIFNFLCINFLPLIFGSEFIWYTAAVAEGICMVIGVVLWKVSEKNGIVYK